MKKLLRSIRTKIVGIQTNHFISEIDKMVELSQDIYHQIFKKKTAVKHKKLELKISGLFSKKNVEFSYKKSRFDF